jgi:hypothetical protein
MDEDIINSIAEEEKLLMDRQAIEYTDFINK